MHEAVLARVAPVAVENDADVVRHLRPPQGRFEPRLIEAIEKFTKHPASPSRPAGLSVLYPLADEDPSKGAFHLRCSWPARVSAVRSRRHRRAAASSQRCLESQSPQW